MTKEKKTFVEIGLLLAILAAAAWVRFANLRTLPDWFVDEGEYIRLANVLARGSFDFAGLRNSALLIGRPPIFLWMLAGLFKLFGADILVLRAFSAVCGLLVIALSWVTARLALGRPAAFYTALVLGFLPEVVFYNRLGFTYNWLALLTVLFALALWLYLETDQQSWLALACLSAGAAFASDLAGLLLALVLALVILSRRPAELWKLALFGGLPWVCALLPILLRSPADAWHDLSFIFQWGAGDGGAGIVIKLLQMILAYTDMVQRQVWVVLGLAGLLVMPNLRLRNLLFTLLCGYLALFAYARVLTDHYLLPAWPLAAAGLGSLLAQGVPFVFTQVKAFFTQVERFLGLPFKQPVQRLLGSLVSVGIVFALFIAPLTGLAGIDLWVFVQNNAAARVLLPEPHYASLYVPAQDAAAVAAEIQAHVRPGDLVVASGTVFWMVPVEAVDFRSVAIYETDGAAAELPNIRRSRFVIPASLDNARYAVVDFFWRSWASHNAAIADLLQRVSRWPLVMTQGSLELHCNPRYCP